MLLKDIKVGTKLEILKYDDEGKLSLPELISSFERLLEDDVVEITTPIYKSQLYHLNTGSLIQVIFYCEDTIYQADAQVIGRKYEGEIAITVIRVLGEIQKLQRRQFFRFRCALDVMYGVASPDENKDSDPDNKNEEIKNAEGNNPEPMLRKAVTRDISGGGVCIICDENLEVGTDVRLKILIGEDWVPYEGRVMRCQRAFNTSNDSRKGKYEVSISFVDASEKSRQLIIKYIFDQQRKLRLKGLI